MEDDHDLPAHDIVWRAGVLEQVGDARHLSLIGTGRPDLDVDRTLKVTLESTNPCESMIECVRRSARNVKRWQSGGMALRWTAAGMLEAEQQFRRIIGYSDLAKLVVAIERDLARTTAPNPTVEEALTLATA